MTRIGLRTNFQELPPGWKWAVWGLCVSLVSWYAYAWTLKIEPMKLGSRLACQIRQDPSLSGVRVLYSTVPSVILSGEVASQQELDHARAVYDKAWAESGRPPFFSFHVRLSPAPKPGEEKP